MDTWKPITEPEFRNLFDEQYGELSEEEKEVFDKYRVPLSTATIRRSDQYGDERVFVVAMSDDKTGVLYFDDVEYGFDTSRVDGVGRILDLGGSHYTLREALLRYFREFRE